ncbi:hypothetical protein RB594_006387 [Gaeumannomyces avenae]
MSGRVQKRKPVVASSTARRDNLLANLLSSAVEMPSCSPCEALGRSRCEVSPQDSSRCAECVRQGRSRCDVLGPSLEQLRSLSVQHQKLETELEAAEAQHRAATQELLAAGARVERLRKQKRMWFEKKMRAIRRGIDSIEELERVEREEAEQSAASAAVAPPSVPEPDFPPLSPGWLESGVNPDLDLLALLQPGKFFLVKYRVFNEVARPRLRVLLGRGRAEAKSHFRC